MHPSWAGRWLLLCPLYVGASAALVLVAPLGWAALGGWTFGTATDPLTIEVVSVGEAHPGSRGCDQKAALAFHGETADICLDGRLAGNAPKEGERLRASGVSAFGLLIHELHTR